MGLQLPLDYLVILDLEATCDDPSDPHRPEIVEFPWLVFDLNTNTVLDHKQIFIAPRWNVNPNPPPDAVRRLAPDLAFVPTLADALLQFDAYIYQSFVTTAKSFYLVFDGHWDLTCLLFAEAARKALVLAPHFRTYINLRNEFSRCYPSAPVPTDRTTMFACLDISTEPRASGLDECVALATLVNRMLKDGHRFNHPEMISEYDWATLPARIPAVATGVATAVPVGGIIRLRGLPWTSTEADVETFLAGIPIVPSGIHFVHNAQGKATGEAFIQLETAHAVSAALDRHKHTVGKRYIEVFKSSPLDMANHLGRADARRHLQSGSHTKGRVSNNHSYAPKNGRQHQQHHQQHHIYQQYQQQHHQPQQKRQHQQQQQQRHHERHDEQRQLNNYQLQNHSHQQQQHANEHANQKSSFQQQLHQSQPQTHPELQEQYRLNSKGMHTRHPSAPLSSGVAEGTSFVVRVSGLPSTAVADDLLPVLNGLEVIGDGIHVVRVDGQCTGEAFLELVSEAWGKKALERSGTTVSCAGANPVPIEIRKSSPGQLAGVLNSTGGHTRRRKSTSPDVRFSLRARHLDDAVTVEQVRDLFHRFDLQNDDIRLSRSGGGDKRERVARVGFRTREARDAALAMTSVSIDGASVVLEDAGGGRHGRHEVVRNMSACVVRMRGLPFTSNEEDIVHFFDGYTIAPNGISRGKDRHGRASGEAWVTFVSADDAREAVDKLDKAHMGNRYIELKF